LAREISFYELVWLKREESYLIAAVAFPSETKPSYRVGTFETVLLAIKNQSMNLKSKGIGGVTVAFRGYFIFAILVYFVWEAA
jgi:hypothetical protein